jgi:hypothetical protein
MTTIYRTIVAHLPATPLGLLPARWNIEHHCTVCRATVATVELIEHAQRHTDHHSPTAASTETRRDA